MSSVPRCFRIVISTSFSLILLAGCVAEKRINMNTQGAPRTIAGVESTSLSVAQANAILSANFNALGLQNVSSSLMQLGVVLLQERVRLHGQQTDKMDAFAKAYGLSILTMRSLSLSSFAQLGLDDSQVKANLAFFVDLETKIISGQTIASLQTSIRGPLFLLYIMNVSKFEPQIHEYSYLSEALMQMLTTQSPQEVLTVAIPFAVYLRAIRTANYPVTASEETAFIGYISQQIQNGTSPVAIGDYAIQSLILFRSMRLGYLPLTPTFEKDLSEVIAPMLAQNKSADQIVGELVNNIPLTCGTAAVIAPGRITPTPLDKEVSKITFVDIINKLQQTRGVAQTTKKFLVSPRDIGVLKAKKSLKADVSLMVKPRAVKMNVSNIKPNIGYLIAVPKVPYDRSIQDRMIADVKRMAPAARVVKSLGKSFNIILVENLGTQDIEILVKYGYEVTPNAKAIFQGMQTCPASQYGADVMPMSASTAHVGASALHAQGIRGQGVKIGIVDTGFEVTHPDFECPDISSATCRAKVGFRTNQPSGFTADNTGHGTHVASIAAGRNGIAPGAQIVSYLIVDAFDVIEILSISVGRDQPKVLNMSFSFPEDKNSVMAQLIDQVVRDNDVSVAAAAGNCSLMRGQADDGQCNFGAWDSQGIYSVLDQRNVIGAPGIAKRAIAVGVTDRYDNYGSSMSIGGPSLDGTSLVKPDLVAPGRLICAAGVSGLDQAYGCGIYHVNRGGFFGWCDEQHAVLSGSSMSAPMVTGSVALLKQKFPHWNTDEVKSALRLSANSQVGNISAYGLYERGAGRLDVLKASTISGYPPVVRIDKVEMQSTAQSKGFVITGAVYDRDISGKGLREYRVSIGKGDKPLSFTHLKSFGRSVGSLQNNESLIAISNIPSCYQGKYVLKIEGEDGDGNIASDYVMVNL